MKLSKCAKYSTESMRRGQNGVANAMFLCLISSVFFSFFLLFFKEICKETFAGVSMASVNVFGCEIG